MSPLIEAVDLTKSFGPTAALAGASLAVEPGEIVAIMGPSGSGKSTLMHCMAGILHADGGAVHYAGRDLVRADDAARSRLRRQQFGFVFQFGHLVPELTCLENVALPLRLNGIARRRAERLAADWLERVQVPQVSALRPGKVSGGQAQRIAIARALITTPKVIFADEPTGALDSLSGELVLQLFTTAARENGAAVLLVTHEPRVAAYADREITVRDGVARDLRVLA